MSAVDCARAASDLTTLVIRLGQVSRTLERHSTLEEHDFGGLSGDAFRRRAALSSETAATLASQVAVLAGALSALGRELDLAHQLRRQGDRSRAETAERQAQQRWRSAVATFMGDDP